MSYLQILKGKKIEFVEFSLSSTEEINTTKENAGTIELYLLLKFEEYSLSIFNNFLLLKNIESANELTGDTLIEVDEKENYINFLFVSGKILQVNMTEEGYIVSARKRSFFSFACG
jgi:hypothetical protein